MKNDAIDYFFSKENYRKMSGGDWPIQVTNYAEEKTLGGVHYHDFFELAVITAGHGVYQDGEGRSFQLVPGNVFLLRPGMIHYYIEQSHLHVTNILWIEEELGMAFHDLPQCPGYHALFELEPQTRSRIKENRSLVLNTNQLTDVQGILRRMQYELDARPPGAKLAAISLAGLLFTSLCRAYADSSQESDNELLQLDRVIAYIHKNYKNPIRRAQLARLASMSEANFYRVFRRVLGCSPVEYLSDIRLKHAEELLRKSHDGLPEIALKTGFSDSNYLGLIFKRRYGITPHQYRLGKR